MADKVGEFLASWKLLSYDDKKKGLTAFTEPSKVESLNKQTAIIAEDSEECPSIVYSDIQFYAYNIYLHSYPTIHWTLDKAPEGDTYWIGLFKTGAKDTDYEIQQYLEGTAQGSYYAGEIQTAAAEVSQNFTQDYELRIFKGEQRLEAETNVLRGFVNVAPTDPFADDAFEILDAVKTKQIDQDTLDFMQAISKYKTVDSPMDQPSLDDSYKQWKSFTPHQQQLLYPILEKSLLPDDVTEPGTKSHDLEDPIIRFPTLGESSTGTDNPEGLNKIVLTITLDKSSLSMFPQVVVNEGIAKTNPWIGMYRIQR